MRIVNPWLIYLITRCDAIVTLAMVVSVMSGVVAIVCLIGRFVKWEEDTREGLMKGLKIYLIICAVSSFISVIVPDKQTCIEMMIADKVTSESVDAGIDAVKEATDYIVEKVKEVK